jgi:hypothetical protein
MEHAVNVAPAGAGEPGNVSHRKQQAFLIKLVAGIPKGEKISSLNAKLTQTKRLCEAGHIITLYNTGSKTQLEKSETGSWSRSGTLTKMVSRKRIRPERLPLTLDPALLPFERENSEEHCNYR